MNATNSKAAPAALGWREAIDTWWVVLLVLFFVTAAPGLPLLWMSRGFSRSGKWFWSLAVLIWTALILWAFWLVMVWCYHRLTAL